MQWQIGLAGLGLLASLSIIFGLVAHAVLGMRPRWLWLAGTIGWFAGGLVASEVIWGTLTVEEIQPIIDGLALDESLLGGLIAGVIVVIAGRLLAGSPGSSTGRTRRLSV